MGISWIPAPLALAFIEKMAYGLGTAPSLESLGERILAGDHNALAIYQLLPPADVLGVWDRFSASIMRVYGEPWHKAIKKGTVIACPTRGCIELAWGETCDLCLSTLTLDERRQRRRW